MRYSFVAVALAATSVYAQNLSDLPPCALSCILSAVPSTGCDATDFPCVCKAADKLTPIVTPCAEKACEQADIDALPADLEKFCAEAGVTITVTPPTQSATSTATGTTAETTVSTETTAPGTTAPGTTAPGTTAPGTTAPVSTTAAGTTMSAATTVTSTVPSGVAGGSGTGLPPTVSAPTSTPTFNAAASNDLKVGAAAAVAFAAMLL